MMRWAAFSLLLVFVSSGETGASRSSSFAQSVLDLVHSAAPDARSDDEWSFGELERIAAMVRETVRQHPEAAPVSLLNQTVFETLGFAREVDDSDLAFVLLPSVLKTRRGSCVGLGTLYLALGQMLGWKTEALMMPGHFFVRVEGSNVELLRRGEHMTDAWYRGRFPVSGGNSPQYERALTPTEVLGVIEYDIGNERSRQGRLDEARRQYQRAARDFPAFAEAHASLGATLHLLGVLEDAERAYGAARRLSPHLPGLDGNVELLERERREGLPR
jgi:regulator of sirC expression with transglutaminase-like and TPR domain